MILAIPPKNRAITSNETKTSDGTVHFQLRSIQLDFLGNGGGGDKRGG